MKNKKLHIILIENQISSIFILILIYIFSPYFNFWHGLIIAEIFSNSIGIIYFLLEKLLYSFIKIEIQFLRKILQFLILIFSFFSGIVISEYIMSNLLSFNLSPSYKYLFLIVNIILIFLIVSIILIYRKLRIKIIENEKLKSEKLKSELIALRAKLNPHFLFNTLNAIIDMAYESPEKVEQIIINLSDIYRKILYSSDKDFCTVEDELNIVTKYLEIEKVRLGDRLKYYINIDKKTLNYKIPTLIIEPLVENAIIHGIAPKKNGGFININIHLKNTLFIIEISDNGIGKVENIRYGFGISSVINRLNLIYKNNANFNIYQNNPSGIKVIISIQNMGEI
ncbi:hypothetical protein X275_04655 [Marinitoga sp. 1197]|uniref:sensor histidine kinase n=1 Tax=Marinitoga sp. 1197 TaxID=1428449 RepID=UPI000640EC3A|nr:histidine kinase [Marinitoga sp. 1197]KLO22849.1 hypothetical protein X275_04655 [Marinitoga sp. 1197]